MSFSEIAPFAKHGLFVPQEAARFERVSEQTGQAPALPIQLEARGDAAFEDGID